MDDNIKIVIITILGVTKDILLVLAGGLITFFIQKWAFNRENVKTIKNKEEAIIIDSIDFLNKSIHEIQRFAHKQDKEIFEEFFEKDYFPRLGIIQFQLDRIEDKKISMLFDKAYDVFAKLGALALMPEAGEHAKFYELTMEVEKNIEAYCKYCAEYLKLKTTLKCNT